jgi:hypothetical protein
MPKGQPTAPETIAEIIRLRDSGMGTGAITHELNKAGIVVSAKTVGEYAPGRLSYVKREILLQLTLQKGPWDLSDFSYGRLGTDHSSVVRHLHDLRKAGMVSFLETTNSKSAANGHHHVTLRRIEITPSGRKAVNAKPQPNPLQQIVDDVKTAPMTDVIGFGVRNPYRSGTNLPGVPTVAPGGPVEHVYPEAAQLPDEPEITDEDVEIANSHIGAFPGAYEQVVDPEPVVPTIDEQSWPELERLKALAESGIDAVRKADAYLAAAELLESIDAFQSASLATLAEDAVREFSLTRTEAEYLAFAKACGR